MSENNDPRSLIKSLVAGMGQKGPGYRVFMDEVEVVEEEKEVVRPDVIQFLMQAAAVSQLTRLRKLEESKVPTGAVSPILFATERWQHITLQKPWLSFSLVNAGPGDVFLRVNIGKSSLSPDAPIGMEETYNIDFDYPIIQKIYYRSADGTTAIVRVFAEEGQWA